MEINNKPVSQALLKEQLKPEKISKNHLEKIQSQTVMANLWERMSHLYGHKWASVYGDKAIDGNALTDVAKTWSSGLSRLSGEQLADGLRACCERSDPWPPTLPEFRSLCINRQLNEYGLTHVPEYYRPQIKENSRLLSSTQRDANREKSKSFIDEMRSKLK